MQKQLTPQDIVSDADYALITNRIITRAKRDPDGSWIAYEEAKKNHHQEIGYIPADPRYRKFIDRLTDALGL